MQVVDVPLSRGLAEGQSSSLRLRVKGGTPLRVVLVWTDPPGTVRPASDTTPQLVNDLDLRLVGASSVKYGNGDMPDRLNNVEVISVADPEPGMYTINVAAHHLGFGPRQSYALVVTGDISSAAQRVRAVRH